MKLIRRRKMRKLKGQLFIKHAAQLATPTGNGLRTGRQMSQIRFISDAAVYIEDGLIKRVGSTNDIEHYLMEHSITPGNLIDATGKTIVPGFVDSHTHFLFAGYRPEEFVQRIAGKSYLQLMADGGGIEATVQPTRRAPFEELLNLGSKRLTEMLSQGVTTVEGKSGYGLDYNTEIKELEVMGALNKKHAVDLHRTYLGAHAFPKEYSDPNQYVDWMVSEMLPEIKRRSLAEFVDVFCDKDVYTYNQTKKILSKAKQIGLKLKLHADEIENLRGVQLAVNLQATSADHLLTISNEEIQQLSENNSVVATLLPATAFCLKETYAPARKMIDAGVGVALASDYNPGSAFTCSAPLIASLACLKMNMTLPEILTALTLNGAAALDVADKVGSIEAGKQADMVLLKYPDYQYIVYHTGMNIVDKVIKAGKLVFDRTK